MEHGFAAERETSDTAAIYRGDDDRRLGVFITSAGAAAIGVTLPEANELGDDVAPVATQAVVGKAPAKTTFVLDLLRRPAGPPAQPPR